MSMILSNFWNFLMPMSAVVSPLDPKCNYYQELAMGELYYIFNNEYPRNYTAGYSCQWIAKSPLRSQIFLSCEDLNMPKSSNCQHDRLEISSSGPKHLSESHTYCGSGSVSLILQGSTLSVVLRTRSRSQGGRFFCAITAIESNIESDQSFDIPMADRGCNCGWKNDKKITGGHETRVNEYPAMVGLVDATRRIYCGGTIISNTYVLTAAHCVHNRDARTLYVQVGDHDVSTGDDTPYSALYKVVDYEMAEGYNPITYEGDIALVKVNNINFNENVGPICLPFRHSFNNYAGNFVTALGWGQLEFSGRPSDTLQEVDLEIIANEECEQSALEPIPNSEFCTYTSGKDTCQSDSGGPLLWQNQSNGRLFIWGIVSHGAGCGSLSPGINTRVASFLKWIQDRTDKLAVLNGIWWLLLLALKVEAQDCNDYIELVAGQEYYIASPSYPNFYSQPIDCVWNLRTAIGSQVLVSCDLLLPNTQNCYGGGLYVSTSGNVRFTDGRIYCGNNSFSAYSQQTTLALGLYGTGSPGGKFLCTATAIKLSTPKSSVQENGFLNCDCGWRPLTRILGGVETGINEFPFMAAIIYKGNLFCGGSIISDRFILSAAHCVVGKTSSDFFILVGDHNLNTGADTQSSGVYNMNGYVVHPDYQSSTQKNDISIVQVKTQIIFSAKVGPVCLPFRYSFRTMSGEPVLLIGWGQLEFSGPTSPTLQKVDVRIVSTQQCNQMQSEVISQGEICTYSDEPKDACQFDSGGPVVWLDRDTTRYQLIGIISHGVPCGSAAPAVNTR
ncbi:hypothetical protein HUJ05_012867, partial [Dendroctonus ponderosae]